MIQVNALGPTLILRHLLSMLTCDGAVMGASRCRSCAASLMRTGPACGQAISERVPDDSGSLHCSPKSTTGGRRRADL